MMNMQMRFWKTPCLGRLALSEKAAVRMLHQNRFARRMDNRLALIPVDLLPPADGCPRVLESLGPCVPVDADQVA